MYREVSDSMVSPEIYPKPTKLQKGAWVASENGKVIKIVSINNGKAEVDTTGDGKYIQIRILKV